MRNVYFSLKTLLRFVLFAVCSAQSLKQKIKNTTLWLDQFTISLIVMFAKFISVKPKHPSLLILYGSMERPKHPEQP